MKKSYYAIIPANVRYDRSLRPNSKLLYGEITALCNEKGYCWASNSYFAELYNVSKETISRWISELANKGYIKVDIVYKKDSNEIDERYIRINHDPIDEKINTPRRNSHDPIDEMINPPIDEKVKENNTVINNTSNNTKEYIPYAEIVQYLNEKAGKKYKHTAYETKKLIKARWNEKHTLEDFKKVIDICCENWKGAVFDNGKKGDTYLRPSTIFNGKFNERLNWTTNKAKKPEYEVDYEESNEQHYDKSGNVQLFR